jgi:peptidoglycan/xylan/chitin deacetylase (PgdA/CDA1 family)
VRIVLRLLLALVLLLASAAGLWRLSGSRTFQLFGRIVARVETQEKVVALTFDDGPAPAHADEILRVLRESGVRATFFLTGAEVERNPGLARRLATEGHELGNHTFSHPRMLLRSPSFIRAEVERTDSLLRAAGQAGPILFRPPYGRKLLGLPLYLSRTGRTTVTWDVEPDSYPEVAATADGITRHVLERVRPGSIVLLHPWYDSRRTSREAIVPVIAGLRARGYRIVTVSELLALSPQ